MITPVLLDSNVSAHNVLKIAKAEQFRAIKKKGKMQIGPMRHASKASLLAAACMWVDGLSLHWSVQPLMACNQNQPIHEANWNSCLRQEMDRGAPLCLPGLHLSFLSFHYLGWIGKSNCIVELCSEADCWARTLAWEEVGAGTSLLKWCG